MYAHTFVMCSHIRQVMDSEEFMLLPVNQLIDIISSEELNVQNEEQVYVAAMARVKHSLEERKSHLSMVCLQPCIFGSIYLYCLIHTADN